jgi:hypothetical protein
MMVSVSEVPSASGTLQGTTSQDVVGAGPRLGDDAGSLLRDLVVHDAGAGVFRSATLGDVAPALWSSRTGGPGMSGLCLSDPPGFSPLPINRRRVGDDAESACSQVAVAERLLHEMLSSVHQNILCLIRVSLGREKVMFTFL